MTIKHFIKVIPIRIGSTIAYFKSWKKGYQKMRDVHSLLKLKKRLKQRIIEKERQNTDGSLKDAFGMECQINIINWILGKDVLRK